MKKRKKFIPLKHPVCSDAVDETEEKKISIFKSLGEGYRTFFGLVWFCKKYSKKILSLQLLMEGEFIIEGRISYSPISRLIVEKIW